MKIINQKEIDAASKNIFVNKGFPIFPNQNNDKRSINSFNSGVEFAEKKFTDIAIKFAEWIAKNAILCKYDADHISINYKASPEKLFLEFLKEQNEDLDD